MRVHKLQGFLEMGVSWELEGKGIDLPLVNNYHSIIFLRIYFQEVEEWSYRIC